jgi:tetratricopeptide (TPR) repeat protein
MSDIVDRLLPFILENRELNEKGINLLQKAHQQIGKKKSEDRTAEEWFIVGYYAQQIQDFDEAQSHYTQAVLKNPDFEAAYKFRAAVCIDTRQFEDAEYDLKKALEIDSTYIDAMFEYARLYHEQDKNDLAIQKLNELIEKEPDYSDAFALLGSTYEKSGSYDKAIESLDKAIELDPESGHYYTQRGLAHYFANNFESAKIDLEKAQRISGVNHITQFNIGLVLGELDDHVKDAFRNFERAFKKAPDMLKQFFEQAGDTEKKRLFSRLENIVKKYSASESTSSQFYREQLASLLDRKLKDAKNISESK